MAQKAAFAGDTGYMGYAAGAYGTKILDRRKEFIREVNEIISEIHFRLTGGKERMLLTYESSMGESCHWSRL